ncbi:hypothetical protein [Pseudomonas gingeri]
MKDMLFSYRYLIGSVLLFGTLVNGFVKFEGDWERFFSIVLVQLLFAQAVFNYSRGGWVAIGPGGLGKDADPTLRAGLAGFAFFAYLVVFFLNFSV